MTVSDEMVERSKFAVREKMVEWGDRVPKLEYAESIARAALTAALSDQVVVPKEPTKEMAVAGRKALAIVADRMEEAKLLAVSSIDFWQRVGHEPANEIYKAMIAAAPPPASTAGGG